MGQTANRPDAVSHLRTWGPPAAAALLIFVLSSIPGRALPPHPEFLNIAAHALEFGVLAVLLARAFVLSGLSGRRLPVVLVVTAACLASGALDELPQLPTPPRVFDSVDLAVDGAASLAGSLLYPVPPVERAA